MVYEINLALFGSGYWGSKLAFEYIQLHKDNNRFNFVGIADPDRIRLSRIGNKLNLSSTMLYDNIEECLHNPDINAIHVATPNETHYKTASEGLMQNKHVLLEKPMTMNSRDAFKLARLAEKNGQVLLVGHIFRFNAALSKAKEILEEGQIGKINYLKLSWVDYLDPIPDRDIIFDLLPHPVDIVNYLTDEWPSSVYAQSNAYTRPIQEGKEDMAFVIMEMPDRRSVEITLSWIQPGIKERSVIITGSEGTMLIDTITQRISIFGRAGRNDINISRNNTIRSMIDHFVDCILGNDNPSNSSLVGAVTVGVLSSARRSMSEKRVLKIFE